jgi:glutathione synthase/RimK-type ligase-like ATP-grasp enzyme
MTAAQPRVALVTCAEYPNLFEDDLLLARELEALGITPVPAIWDDPSIDWTSFDALVMRTPWDYYERAAEFRPWLDARIASGVLMCNAGDILEWNFDKHYLQDLEAAGVALVPTVFIECGEQGDVAALARARGWDEIVVKPTISGGAYRTHRFRVEDAAAYHGGIDQTLASCGLMVQPFLPEIFDGELSLLFFDGVFSHAVRKRAKPGDYRVQFRFGGTTERVEVEPALVAQARACALAAPSLPVYARVDGVVKDGQFLLMELEVFEPLMFLSHDPEAAGRFARAVRGRVCSSRAHMTGHQVSPDDLEFLREFEACRISPEAFDHAAHVRLAYLYLCEHPVEAATARMKASLLAFLAHVGVGPAKYHETITGAWIMAVAHFMRQSERCTSAAAFMSACPPLLDSRIMLSHYSAEVLFSPEARQSFVAPDIQAIPKG